MLRHLPSVKGRHVSSAQRKTPEFKKRLGKAHPGPAGREMRLFQSFLQLQALAHIKKLAKSSRINKKAQNKTAVGFLLCNKSCYR